MPGVASNQAASGRISVPFKRGESRTFSRRSIHGQIAHEIGQRILRGDFTPGAVLPSGVMVKLVSAATAPAGTTRVKRPSEEVSCPPALPMLAVAGAPEAVPTAVTAGSWFSFAEEPQPASKTRTGTRARFMARAW